jgi:hypothetical protein
MRLVRRRTWGFGTLALLPVAAALATTALLIDGSDNYFVSPLAKLGIGVAGLPLIIGVFVLSRWIYRRRWGVIAAWVFVSIAVAVAGGSWAIYAVSDRMAEGQRFSHEGWYWIWIIAGYWTMWLICLWLPLAAVVRRLWTVYAGRRAAV